MSLAEALGGNFDDVFPIVMYASVAAFVLLGWAINVLFDIGSELYDLTKKAAVAVWRKSKH